MMKYVLINIYQPDKYNAVMFMIIRRLLNDFYTINRLITI